MSYAEIGSRDLSTSLCNVKCYLEYNVATRFGSGSEFLPVCVSCIVIKPLA